MAKCKKDEGKKRGTKTSKTSVRDGRRSMGRVTDPQRLRKKVLLKHAEGNGRENPKPDHKEIKPKRGKRENSGQVFLRSQEKDTKKGKKVNQRLLTG